MERLLEPEPAMPASNTQVASKRSWNRLVSGVVLATSILGSILVTTLCIGLWHGRQEAKDSAAKDTLNLAKVIAENTRQGVHQIDLNLVTTEEVFRNWPSGEAISEKQLLWLLKGRLRLMPDVRMLFILDRDGVRTHSASVEKSLPVNTDMSDRDFFIWHRDRPSKAVHVGHLETSRTFDARYIPVSRRLTGPDGEFEGVIVAALETKFMEAFYSSIDTGAGGFIAIFLADSTLIARAPRNENLLGQQFATAPLFKEDLAKSGYGSYRRVTRSDGIPRIGSYVTLEDTGLVVTVGFAEETVFAGWRRQMWTSIAETTAFLAALAAMTFLLVRQLRRQQTIVNNLAQSEANYRRLRDTANEGIWQVNTSGTTVFVNSRLCELLGYTEGEMISRPAVDFVHEDDRSRAAETLTRVQATRNPSKYEIRFRRRDLKVVWTWISAIATRDEDQHPTGMLAMLTDITDRAEAEEQLRRHAVQLEGLHALDQAILQAQSSENIAATGLMYLRKLVPYWRAMVMAIDHENGWGTILNLTQTDSTVYDPGGRLSLADYGFEDIALLKAGRECVVPDLELLPEPSAFLDRLKNEGLRSYVRIPLLAEDTLIGVISLGNNRKGAYSPELVGIARAVADQMAIALRQASLRQQVQQHATNLELRVAERTQQLDSVNRELEAFAASVSHDLRAPVRHITGFATILVTENPALDPASKKYVERIMESAARMGSLIDGLLALAHTGSCDLHFTEVDMNHIVAGVREDLVHQHPGRQIDWKIGDLHKVRGDRSLIQVVMQNLIGNAYKYSSKRADALIEVSSVQRANEQIEFLVRDNGAGFDMQYSSKMFKAFSRLHTDAEFEGTGVGLATVYRIISRHGGRIEAVSAIGAGAEFRFTLPAQSARTY